jgi:hypothetical protein
MKRKKFDVTKEVKAIARERIGIPKPSQPIEPKRMRAKPKHKKSALTEDEAEYPVLGRFRSEESS